MIITLPALNRETIKRIHKYVHEAQINWPELNGVTILMEYDAEFLEINDTSIPAHQLYAGIRDIIERHNAMRALERIGNELRDLAFYSPADDDQASETYHDTKTLLDRYVGLYSPKKGA